MLRTIKLPCYSIEVTIDEQGNGEITSALHSKGESRTERAAMDALESLILACACAGIEIEQLAFIEAIETAVDALYNNIMA